MNLIFRVTKAAFTIQELALLLALAQLSFLFII